MIEFIVNVSLLSSAATIGLDSFRANMNNVTEPIDQPKEAVVEIVEKPETKFHYAEEVKTYFKGDPVLISIAKCESDFRQYDKDGDILRGKVNSKDVGVMQINEDYHLEKSKALGLDIYTLEGNLAYAKELYQDQGLNAWKSSYRCWGELAKR